MKKILFLFAFLAVATSSLRADEGMWLPSEIILKIKDMQAKGFKLTAEDIYSINTSSLKDAVVHFGGGCTGEIISNEGLLITNHHCGFGQIQSHSSVEHDYLRDGFWAMTRAEELPNPGLTVSFLEYMKDVTDEVLKGYKPSMSEAKRIIAETLYQREHMQSMDHAVSEAVHHFNSCPVCGRLVCNYCFVICDDLDLCRACASNLQETGESVLDRLSEG